MDLSSLRIFKECVARGSFAAAARALDLDPSAVSRSIAALEASLGLRLFERSTRHIALTEAGALYHGRVAPVLGDLDDAAEAAKDLGKGPKGRLRVSASTAFGERVIVPMLGAFLASYPDLSMDLRLTDAQVDLVADRLDLAIRLTPEAPPDTIIRKLCATRYRVVAAPSYRPPITLAEPGDLSACDCLLFALPGFRDLWRFRQGSDVIDVPINGRLEVTGAAAIAAAARSGIGPALLAEWLVAEDLASGRLVDLFPAYDVTATGFDNAAWLLTPSRRYEPLKTRVFATALRDHVGGGLAASPNPVGDKRVIPGEMSSGAK
ncbi:MAG: LysR substrate-binding domain-containing protein [Pseudomonadota bacterium]